MPHLILHENKRQSGNCLISLVQYAERIPVRFNTLEDTAVFLRAQTYEEDPGLEESAVPVPDYQHSACKPWQRERVWPSTYNCWEAVAHWLAHALKLLNGNEVVEIWDRILPTGSRHVWPVLERADGIYLVQLEGKRPVARAQGMKPANFGWEDAFGFLHLAGKETLGLFLGNDRAAPIVKFSENAWGDHIADWSKGPSLLGGPVGQPVRDDLKKDSAPTAETKAKDSAPREKKESQVMSTPATQAKSSESSTGDRAQKPKPTTSTQRTQRMDWNDV